jgi:hypothetical protein
MIRKNIGLFIIYVRNHYVAEYICSTIRLEQLCLEL